MTMARVPTYSVLIPNLMLFQGVWWSCILDVEALAIGLIIIMTLHFLWSHQITGDTGQNTDWLILPVIFTGLLTDWLIYQTGMYVFPDNRFPLWLVFLWCAFAMTVPRSLATLVVRKPAWLVLCAVFGPLAYFAGQHYGRLGITQYAILAMVTQWAFIGLFIHFMMSEKIAATLDVSQNPYEVENK